MLRETPAYPLFRSPIRLGLAQARQAESALGATPDCAKYPAAGIADAGFRGHPARPAAS